jgi:hypothetical protein
VDLQFIQFSDALVIRGAQEIPGMTPRSLQIAGPDFRHAVEVLINEINSPNFAIANKNTIIAEVPASEKKNTIRSLSVLSSDFTATFRSRLRFRIGRDPKKVGGLKAMMQTFLKLLFTTSGTDAWAQKLGGSGLKNLGRNFGLGETQTIVSEFGISVRRAETQMKALQSQQTRIPDDERLLAANLLNAKFDVNLTALLARVELISQSGVRAIANLEL